MPGDPLRIRIARRPDGAILFELRRRDGTATWQKRSGPTAEFFAIHDLTHDPVETELGFSEGFYGLVAAGWELADFGTPWPRGPLPMEALVAEVVVGCFDTQRAANPPLTARECNDSARSFFAARGIHATISLSDEDIRRIQRRLSEHVWRWHGCPSGESIGLTFPVDAAPLVRR